MTLRKNSDSGVLLKVALLARLAAARGTQVCNETPHQHLPGLWLAVKPVGIGATSAWLIGGTGPGR